MAEWKPRVPLEWRCKACGNKLYLALNSVEEWPEECTCGAELPVPDGLEAFLRKELGSDYNYK